MMCDLEGRASSPGVLPSECSDWWIQLDTGTGVWTRSRTDSNDPLDTHNSLTESRCYCEDNKNYPDKNKDGIIYFLAAGDGSDAWMYLCLCVYMCVQSKREIVLYVYLQFLHNPLCLNAQMCICLWYRVIVCLRDKQIYPWGQTLQLARPSSVLMVPRGHCWGAAEPSEQ